MAKAPNHVGPLVSQGHLTADCQELLKHTLKTNPIVVGAETARVCPHCGFDRGLLFKMVRYADECRYGANRNQPLMQTLLCAVCGLHEALVLSCIREGKIGNVSVTNPELWTT